MSTRYLKILLGLAGTVSTYAAVSEFSRGDWATALIPFAAAIIAFVVLLITWGLE